MKIYSEITKQFYETVKACEKAEAEALEAEKKAKEEKEKLNTERKIRAAEIDEARKAMVEAQNTYEKLIRDFCRDYGAYHYSTKDINDFPRFFENLFLL